ncbi:hypothetical protein B0H13DRAFT_2084435, partial [Mycena leptocephala]
MFNLLSLFLTSLAIGSILSVASMSPPHRTPALAASHARRSSSPRAVPSALRVTTALSSRGPAPSASRSNVFRRT